MTEQSTVFVVDDDPSVRAALKRLTEAVGFRCETFDSTGEFLRRPAPEGPACLILDVRFPGASGLELQRQLTETPYHVPIIFLTAFADIRTTVRAMKGGAVEFLTKPFYEPELLDAIRHAIDKDRIGRRVYADQARVREHYERLTRRERQVLAGVLAGRLNKQIASDLFISEKTVKVHRAEVMQKMQAGSLAELVSLAGHLRIHPEHDS
jgi:FixJ family two-component response regulator